MALLFCRSPKCCGHEMSYAQIVGDIRRWPRDRMVGPPTTPRCARRRVTYTTNTEKLAALARVDAGESVAAVAAAVGVSRMSVYGWKIRKRDLEAL